MSPSGTSPQVPLSFSKGPSALSAHDIVIESRALSDAEALEICFALQWMHILDRFCVLVAPWEKTSLLQHETSSEECCFGFSVLWKWTWVRKCLGLLQIWRRRRKAQRILDLCFLPSDLHNSETVCTSARCNQTQVLRAPQTFSNTANAYTPILMSNVFFQSLV